MKLAFLTGPSRAGKTTICGKIKLPVLQNDEVIFNEAFRLIGRPEMGQAIKPLGLRWTPLSRPENIFS